MFSNITLLTPVNINKGATILTSLDFAFILKFFIVKLPLHLCKSINVEAYVCGKYMIKSVKLLIFV